MYPGSLGKTLIVIEEVRVVDIGTLEAGSKVTAYSQKLSGARSGLSGLLNTVETLPEGDSDRVGHAFACNRCEGSSKFVGFGILDVEGHGIILPR
jgi:hypothetical protein